MLVQAVSHYRLPSHTVLQILPNELLGVDLNAKRHFLAPHPPQSVTRHFLGGAGSFPRQAPQGTTLATTTELTALARPSRRSPPLAGWTGAAVLRSAAGSVKPLHLDPLS
eukprot:COSAG02_NODE_2387_length_8986_cov_12.395184_13_plen_110_part_00